MLSNIWIKMKAVAGSNFDNAMAEWQTYKETPWGRLRYRVAAANLADHLPPAPAQILDIGGGDGEDSIPLAQQGYTVRVLDFSSEMVAHGNQAARAAGVADRITFEKGDVTQLGQHLAETVFDVVLCHNVLQYVPEPTAVLTDLYNLLHPNGLLSLIITNPHAEPLAAALRDYNIADALRYLDTHKKYVPLFDTTIQRYDDSELITLLQQCGFAVTAQYGIRCVCDYMADNSLKHDPDFYTQLEALELALRDKRPYLSLARAYHFIAQKSG